MTINSDSYTVLIVEDHFDNRETMRCLIEAAGYHALCAENGQSALRQLCQLKAPPRAILLDLMMPTMDGWQLMNELQRNAVFAKIPAVIVSALDLDASSFPGAAGYLRKPVEYDCLRSVLAEVSKGTSHDKDNVGRASMNADTAEPSVMLATS